MSAFFFVLMLLSLAAVLGALGMGFYHLGREGDDSRRKSNTWMRRRIVLQGIALACFALAMLTRRG